VPRFSRILDMSETAVKVAIHPEFGNENHGTHGRSESWCNDPSHP
jgi:hypothetical protein